MLKQLVRRNFGILRGDLNRIRITHHHDAATRVRWFSLSPNMISEAPVQQSLEGGAPVLTKEEKDVGIIALNRPKQLNALLPEMGDIMASKLQAWEKSDAVKMIMVKGIGEKAFCAGGDIKRIIKKIGEGDYEEAERGFGVQYRVFHLVGSLQTSYIAFLNGITMGGGVGLSAHGPFRVATEATVFAMPETCIGLFNDAGTSFLLPRLDGQLGIYLGLTGKRIKGVDVFYSGVATHYVHSSRLAELENRLLSLQTKDHNSVNTLLEECSVDMDQDQLTFSLGGGIRAAIDRCFKYNTIEEIIEALRTETDEPQWAKETLDMLSKASPTSLKVTLELMRKGAKMSLGQCIKTEFELASKFIRGHEFVEGVNALLIERRTPRWNPDTVENVKNVKQEYFEQSSPFKLSLLSDTDFDQYPFSFGLPSDEEIVSALSSMKDYADLDALVRDRFKGKKGVKSKIKDVASRINAAGL